MKTFTPEEIEARRLRLGSSEAGSIMGLNNYCGPIVLWFDKTGKVPNVVAETPSTVRGKLFEPWLLGRYEERCLNDGESLWRNTDDTFTTHRDYPWITATPDGGVRDHGATDFKRLVEIKTANHRVAWKWGAVRSDMIPPEYMAQVQWQMEVMDCDVCDVYAMVDEEERLYVVERNRDFAKIMIEQAVEFWGHVQRREIPPADFSDDFVLAMALRYPERTAPVEATGDLLELCESMAAAYVRQKNSIQHYKLVRNKTLEAMGDTRSVYGDFGRASVVIPKNTTPYVKFTPAKEPAV